MYIFHTQCRELTTGRTEFAGNMGSNVIADPKEILRQCEVLVAPETFTLVSVLHTDWHKLMQKAELSPRMSAPFMILMDKDEVTLLLDETDLAAIRPTLTGGKIENGYRLLTFDVVLDLSIVGFLAEVSRLLAEAGIPIMALSAFSRDHLLIKQGYLAKALKTLGKCVVESGS
jgi:hypothetical protein